LLQASATATTSNDQGKKQGCRVDGRKRGASSQPKQSECSLREGGFFRVVSEMLTGQSQQTLKNAK